MIILQAHMWPHGSEDRKYELLHATIINRTAPGEHPDWYSGTVIARPHPELGTLGFEADVRMFPPNRAQGFMPLLIGTMMTAYDHPGVVAPGQVIARQDLRSISDFDFSRRIRG